jgi:hypothetical protein
VKEDLMDAKAFVESLVAVGLTPFLSLLLSVGVVAGIIVLARKLSRE